MEEMFECSVCFEKRIQRKYVCGHSICDSCAIRWLNKCNMNTCPLCRRCMMLPADSAQHPFDDFKYNHRAVFYMLLLDRYKAGITVELYENIKGVVRVKHVVENDAASNAGLAPGMLIYSVNGMRCKSLRFIAGTQSEGAWPSERLGSFWAFAMDFY